MNRDAFYSDFLAPLGMRYYVSGTLQQTKDRFGLFSVQRSSRQGHVDESETTIVEHILPHIRRALDLSIRLDGLQDHAAQLEHSLDHHADGVVLIAENGSVVQANKVAREVFRHNNGLGVRNKQIEFADRTAKKYFGNVLRAMTDKTSHASWPKTEFLAAKESGGYPYALSVLPAHTLAGAQSRNYLAIIFIRDPDRQHRLSRRRVQKILGLTEAETQLAVWIGEGRTLKAYARYQDISMNTVYTHFRHLKEKAGCQSQMTLVAKIRQIAL